MRGFLLVTAISVLAVTLVIAPPPSSRCKGLCQIAYAEEEAWKQEFADLCAKTNEAMSLTTEELKLLLQKGEKLKEHIENLDESPKKVYMRRLQKCMSLYSFVLESKEAEQKP